ncbi:MaoC/PaaZ C-terminal domain-containing protein [Streptomyces sp. NPDC056910]|uniref:MaoC/PaaZ C-terminal domain-containing protein n=1 Tax=Streptomyces sp. NPDC056910 TaxID=3345964 RepID=UPI0036CBBCC9
MTSAGLGDDSPLYFEDIPLKQVFRSTGRTITEADIVAFAGLSADYNPLHVDEHYAAATPLGGRVAQGLLVLAIATGLTTRLPIYARIGTSVRGLRTVNCSWPQPTRIGDTLYGELQYTEANFSGDSELGEATLWRNALNQDGAVVMQSQWKVLMLRRPKAD